MHDQGDTDARNVPRNALPGFFLLTFVFTWTAWLASAALATPGNTGPFGLGGPVFLLGVFAPAFVALALTAYAEGGAGTARLLVRIGRWQVGARWYLFAIGYMAATKLLAALIHRMVMGDWPAFGDTSLPLMLGAILVSIWAQAGEEVGWRGYALPRLATHLGLGGASVVLGVIWALWHLPLFFLPGSGSDGQSFPIYLLHVTALSVAMSWLYWKTEGSLLLVMLMHASVNNTTGIVPAAAPHAVAPLSFEGTLVAWATVGASSAVAVLLLCRMRGADVGGMLGSGARQFRIGESVVMTIGSPGPRTEGIRRRGARADNQVAGGRSAWRLAVEPERSAPSVTPVEARLEFETRRATEADAPGIASAHIDSIRTLGPAFYPTDVVEAWGEGLAAQVYVNAMRAGEAFFVATGQCDGASVVLGFATHRVDDDQDGASVYVRGAVARRGIGSALLCLAEQHARDHGAKSIQIQASLAGVEFYRANGFDTLGDDKAVLMTGKSMACQLMRKILTP